MIILRKLDPARNMARFYALDLQRSLFGQAVLVRRWGRIGTYGRRREDWFDDAAAAECAMQSLAGMKTRRGYSITAL